MIEDNRDDEGRLEIIDDEVMYNLLGFSAEDEMAKKAREAANNLPGAGSGEEVDTTGAAIVVDDYLLGEMIVAHDPNRPNMAFDTVYRNQE